MDLVVEEVLIPQLGGLSRTARVLLPPGYREDSSLRCPVLYMQDGHNLFDPAVASYGTHWAVAESLAALQAKGLVPPIIVAALDCNQEGFKRLDEYSPWVNTQAPRKLKRFFGHTVRSVGGEGEAYAAFLADTFKHWVDARFRTLPDRAHTAIAGSSMGGLISLYAAYRRPDLYAGVGAFSTALWFAREELFTYVRKHFKNDILIYADIGTMETSDDSVKEFPSVYERDTRDLAALLEGLGLPAERLRLVVEQGASHCEAAWARRFPGFISWLAAGLGWI